MSRQRKTFISDAYAARQARFAVLPPAKVVRPLQQVRAEAARARQSVIMLVHKYGGEPAGDRGAALRAAKAELRKWVQRCRHLRVLAKAGDGTTVEFLGRYYLDIPQRA